MGLKIKNIIKDKKKEDISNFSFMSGYEKNKVRYRIHQMTQEMDHTQALMDFIRLVFKVVPRKELLGSSRKVIYHL